MKTLYLDCGMGAAGDMLTAALVELMPDPDAFIDRLNSLGIPHVKYIKEESVKCGITGAHISVLVEGHEEDEHMHDHHHDHDHGHDHHHDHEHEHHHHSGMHDIEHIVHSLSLPTMVKLDVLAVYKIIAEAESKVHGRPVSEIHFHEVGTMDAVADVAAVCLLINELEPDEIVVSPVHVGSGQVKCAHGILPVPAPATALILEGVPIYGGSIKGELCTPTGAALLKYYADRFGDMPVMKIDSIGYGMGKKDFEAANTVRAMFGDTKQRPEFVIELSCNVDDMTAEDISYAMNKLFEAGAREVFTVPAGMKKSRPGTLIKTICDESLKGKIVETLFKYTTTIGIREVKTERYVLTRTVETVDTKWGKVRRKISSGYNVKRVKYEHDDLEGIADKMNVSIDEVRAMLSDE